MASFVNIDSSGSNLQEILGINPAALFESFPNIVFFNNYIYSGFRSTTYPSLLYKLNPANTDDFSTNTSTNFNGVTAIAVDSSGVYSYSTTNQTEISVNTISDLTPSTTISLITAANDPFALGNCKYLFVSGNNFFAVTPQAINLIMKNNNTGVVTRLLTLPDNLTINAVCNNPPSPTAYAVITDSSLNTLNIYSYIPGGDLTNIYTFPDNTILISNQITCNDNLIYVQYKDVSGSWFMGQFDLSSNLFVSYMVTQFYGNAPLAGITFDKFTDTMYVRQANGNIIYKSTYFCFNEGTKIRYLNQELFDQYVPIEQLQLGDYVKTYKHGYRKIIKIIKGSFRNNPNKWNMCMYKMTKTKSNKLLDDLIVTGGHSILVDSITKEQQTKYDEMGISDFSKQTIDGKHLLLACVSEEFTPMQDNDLYTYYHLLLNNEGEDERVGIWANGILTETPNEKALK